MPGNEDWRYKKAQELGLTDIRPVSVPPRKIPASDRPSPVAAKPVVPPATTVPPRPVPTVPPPAAAVSPPRAAVPASAVGVPATPIARRTPYARVAAIAAGLAVAASAGWVMHAEFGGPRSLPVVATAPAVDVPRVNPVIPPPTEAPPVEEPPVKAPPVEAPAVETPPVETPPASVASARPPVQVTPGEAVAAGNQPGDTAPSPTSSPPVATKLQRKMTGLWRQKPPQAARAVLQQPPVTKAARIGRAAQPSFSCSRVQTRVNQMICNDASLSGLDVALASEYRRAVQGSALPRQLSLDRQQAAFLNARSNCQTQRCIAQLYRARINALRPD